MRSYKKLGFEFGSALDVGRQRRHKANQDSLGWLLPNIFNQNSPIFIVADGMGGHQGGQIASQIVVDEIKRSYKKSKPNGDPLNLLKNCILKAHQEIVKRGNSNKQLASMGSTVAACIIDQDTYYISNVGDTRVYLVSRGKISQISYDHSWVAEQYRQGIITLEEMQNHPHKNRLTMSVSAKRSSIDPYVAQGKIQSGDIIMLCSDGLWGMVPDSLILTVASELLPQHAADKLVTLANANKGVDNISIILLKKD